MKRELYIRINVETVLVGDGVSAAGSFGYVVNSSSGVEITGDSYTKLLVRPVSGPMFTLKFVNGTTINVLRTV